MADASADVTARLPLHLRSCTSRGGEHTWERLAAEQRHRCKGCRMTVDDEETEVPANG